MSPNASYVHQVEEPENMTFSPTPISQTLDTSPSAMSPVFASDPKLSPYGSILSPEHATPSAYDPPTPNDGQHGASYYEEGSRSIAPSSLLSQTNTDFDISAQDMETSNAYAGYSNPAVSPQLYGAMNWNPAGTSSWPASAAQPPGSFMPQPGEYYGVDEFAEVTTDMDGQLQPVERGDVMTDYATNGSPEYIPSGKVTMTTEVKKQPKRNRRRSSASAKSKPILDGSGHHRPATQLRTAQRSSKYNNSSHKPAESAEERKARAMHNQVEQQYRKRLNAQFERLLAALPPEDHLGSESGGATATTSPGSGGLEDDKRVSKAEVLDRARQRIRALEKERASLEKEKGELVGCIGRLREEWSRKMGPGGHAMA